MRKDQNEVVRQVLLRLNVSERSQFSRKHKHPSLAVREEKRFALQSGSRRQSFAESELSADSFSLTNLSHQQTVNPFPSHTLRLFLWRNVYDYLSEQHLFNLFPVPAVCQAGKKGFECTSTTSPHRYRR